MKTKITTLFLLICMACSLSVSAQSTINVSPTGDALNEVINADFVSGNTYVLERGGYYVLTGSISVTGDISIVAADGDGVRPVIVMGTDETGGSYGYGLFYLNGDVTLKSLQISVSNDLGSRGSWNNTMLSNAGSNKSFFMDDCIIDFSDGYIYNASNVPMKTIKLTNNLIRWNGYIGAGAWNGFGLFCKNGNIEEVIFENNTWVECIAPIFVHENSMIGKFWFNHNTIVSHGQYLMRCEYWTEAIFMNNLFVDAHFGGESHNQRIGQDPDQLPYGIITIASYAQDSLRPVGYPEESDRAFLIAYNDNYVSPGIKDFWDNADSYFSAEADWQVADYTKGDNGFLNSRAVSMMADDSNYPYFLWDDELSILTDNPGLTDYTFDAVNTVNWALKSNGDTTANDPSTAAGSWGIHPDAEYPMSPVEHDYWDLSYSSNKLKSSAHLGYPLGDLNWWPEEKAQWEADEDRETYSAMIEKVKNNTFEFVNWPDSLASGISINNADFSNTSLGQNYPNPAMGTTTISFEINSTSHICLKISNILGQVSKVVVDGVYPAGKHAVQVNLDGLKSGNYIYQLETDDVVLTKKMFIK